MSDSMDNLKQGFSDPRTRLAFIFVAIVAVVVFFVGVKTFRKNTTVSADAKSTIQSAKGVQSIPGAVNQTEAYTKLQQQENDKQARVAREKGTSAIPTIVGSNLFSKGNRIEEIDDSKKGVGFSALSRLQKAKDLSAAWFQALKDSDCSDAMLRKAVAQGASATQLKAAGCPAKQLCDTGFSLKEMVTAGYSASALKSCGHSSKSLKGAGFSVRALQEAGVSACEQKSLGENANSMLKGGYTIGELKGAGFSDDLIRRAEGIPDGVDDDFLRQLKCDLKSLRMAKARGISAAVIKRRVGCSAVQLRRAGYSLKDLMEAGYSAAALRQAGFDAAALKAAGFDSLALRKAGFSATELKAAGFSPAELLRAGFTPCHLKAAAISGEAQRAAGITVQQLAESGASDIELKAAGFDAKAIESVRPNATALQALMKSGCRVSALRTARNAGITANLIRRQLNCPLTTLRKSGFTATQLRYACYTAKALKAAGFTAAELRAAGFTARELKDAGFTAKELADAGFSAKELLEAGFSPSDLRKAGFSAADLKLAGLSAAALKDAGFSAADLKNAGFSAADLKAIGFSPDSLRKAGFSADDLKNAGFSVADLKAAGFSAEDLKNAGFSAADLKAAGFSAADLRKAGFSTTDLKAAGFSAEDLKNAGFSAADLKAAGFSSADLKNAGFSAADLKAAGFSAKALKAAGFDAAQLRAAGFSPRALKEAGYSAKDLLKAGFSSKQISRVGFTNQQARRAAEDLLSEADAGVSDFSKEQLNQLSALANGLLVDDQGNADKLAEFMRQQSKQLEVQLKRKDQRDALSNMERFARQITKQGKQPKQQFVLGKPEKAVKSSTTEVKETKKVVLDPGFTINDPTVTDFEEHFTRAGDITFAILDTAINTDEPGPIMATVVSGPFHGAKLLGTLGTLSGERQKVTLNFNSMSLPDAKTSVPVTAVAIDPDTARTALSSYTNNHILLRYGSLFASSFMKGYADAISERGTTVTANAAGDTTVNSVPLDGREQVLVAIGELGNNWSTEAKRSFNRKPTIHVYSGTNMAILFTQNFVVKIPKRDNFRGRS